jgi:hypothetical protein
MPLGLYFINVLLFWKYWYHNAVVILHIMCSTFLIVLDILQQCNSVLCSMKEGLTHIPTLHYKHLNFVLISSFCGAHRALKYSI